MAPVNFNLVCFRYRPEGVEDVKVLDKVNEMLLNSINETGKAYLSHTRLDGQYVIRMVIGQTRVEQKNVDQAWELIKEKAWEIKIEEEE